MSDAFDYAPHPHISARQVTGPPTTTKARAELHGEGRVARFNAKVGMRITILVGTMWTAYVFTLLALLSAPQAFGTANLLIIVAWIAQTFLQLVLLPIIIVGQNVLAKAADARSQATYDDASAVLAESRQIQEHLAAQDEAMQAILAEIKALRAAS